MENVENFSSFMAGVFLTRREISCSELSYLMNDYSIKMNSYIVEDDDEIYMFNNFIHFDNKKIFVKEAYDDYVNINNECEGEVTDVKFLATYLLTYDKQVVVVPNKTITNSIITNYSTYHLRRVVISVGVDYSCDIDKVKEVMISLTKDDPRISKDFKPSVVLNSFGEYSLNFALRFYVDTNNYWDTLFEYNEKIINSFQKENINIPYQRINIGHIGKEIVEIKK